MSKKYTPNITVRRRSIDNWFEAECPNCGVSIIDRTTLKVKNNIRDHGKQQGHNWNKIKFYEQR
jgi:predicted RNA-binding Zn-ribbon protein involved in translation (DUF1610 family)